MLLHNRCSLWLNEVAISKVLTACIFMSAVIVYGFSYYVKQLQYKFGQPFVILSTRANTLGLPTCE